MNFFKTLFRVQPVEDTENNRDLYYIDVKRAWSNKWEFHHGWYLKKSEAQETVGKLKAIKK